MGEDIREGYFKEAQYIIIETNKVLEMLIGTTRAESSPALTSESLSRLRACNLGRAGGRHLDKSVPRTENMFGLWDLNELEGEVTNEALKETGRSAARLSSSALTSWTRLRPRAWNLG